MFLAVGNNIWYVQAYHGLKHRYAKALAGVAVTIEKPTLATITRGASTPKATATATATAPVAAEASSSGVLGGLLNKLFSK